MYNLWDVVALFMSLLKFLLFHKILVLKASILMDTLRELLLKEKLCPQDNSNPLTSSCHPHYRGKSSEI